MVIKAIFRLCILDVYGFRLYDDRGDYKPNSFYINCPDLLLFITDA